MAFISHEAQMKTIFFKGFLTKGWLKKPAQGQKLIINKKLQFLSYHHETWSKWLAIEGVLLTKFCDDGSKIVDFLSVVNFWPRAHISESVSMWRRVLEF